MWTIKLLIDGDEFLIASPLDATRPVRVGCEAGAVNLAADLTSYLDPQRQRSEQIYYVPVDLDGLDVSQYRLTRYHRKPQGA